MEQKSNNSTANFFSIILGIIFLSFFLFDLIGLLDNYKENSFFWIVLEGFGIGETALKVISFILGIYFIYPIFKLKSKK